MKRLVVVGAGPMGLEAAALGKERGFDVTVLEAGEVGAGVLRWGRTRAFSPLSMNLSPRVRAFAAPRPDDALLSGVELATMLGELARALGCVRTNARVRSISRLRMSRQELVGHPIRAERAFRVLIDERGVESYADADVVLDASGVAPAPLEVTGARAVRVLDSLGALHDALDELRGHRVAVVGHGHSAGHAVGLLEPIASALVWLVRTNRTRPLVEVPGDPLPERARVVDRANAIAQAPPAHVTIERRTTIERIAQQDGALHLQTTHGTHVVDAIVALVGQRPDLDVLRELPIELAPATEGAARLWRAISNVTDCLNVPAVSPEALESGEPGFHLVGSKSYGRARTFLLRTGREQLETIFSRL